MVPEQVEAEITSGAAVDALSATVEDGTVSVRQVPDGPLARAAAHLGKPSPEGHESGNPDKRVEGDLGILGLALLADHDGSSLGRQVVLTDDKPLRKACKALSIPVSGSIGVLVRAVERGDLASEDAKASVEAMDEVGARLSASLLRRAERLIDDAASHSD